MKKTTLKKSISKKTLPLPKAKALANKNTSFYIVGIGASAGGLEALKIFFNNTPPTCGMAFVVVQHLDPTRKSLLTELLAECTKMKVKEVADGILVLPDCIYIIPPNKELEIFKGHLQLFSPTKKRGSRRPIDSFFHSLAIDQKEKAIGIVLSGTGSDGSIGLKEIKAAGGKTFVQEPKSALFRGMPESAISGKVADHILPPEKMPAQLQRFSEIIRKKTEETPLKF
ncbi:MAG: chemotaxis protein CheB, partial [Bacteroidetes bacterium]|nr:chemotaxis protein CheB [Bacteroidota bacterium]